ncbi:MAG: hypothetical protein M2R45_00169 [Verrucomicrobia subdivision 3 bacterium]|nr:hypothetical protein [Limisphaerales bacterium]MCS1412372.1 hypothetical protein [Limisphaerales bacterium]
MRVFLNDWRTLRFGFGVGVAVFLGLLRAVVEIGAFAVLKVEAELAHPLSK